MIINVSISQFRQHISDYIAKAKSGYTVILEDEKKGQEIAQLVGKRKFNPEAFGKALDVAAGIFSVKNHPEWRSKVNISRWLQKERVAADRKF